jgi:hypothetical protein
MPFTEARDRRRDEREFATSTAHARPMRHRSVSRSAALIGALFVRSPAAERGADAGAAIEEAGCYKFAFRERSQ